MSAENPNGTSRPDRSDRRAALCAVTPTPPPHLWLASIWWAAVQELVSIAFDWPRVGPFLGAAPRRVPSTAPPRASGTGNRDAT